MLVLRLTAFDPKQHSKVRLAKLSRSNTVHRTGDAGKNPLFEVYECADWEAGNGS
jgi:hypothetical protein